MGNPPKNEQTWEGVAKILEVGSRFGGCVLALFSLGMGGDKMKDTQSVQSWQEVVVEADQEMEDVEEEEPGLLVCFVLGFWGGDLGCSSKSHQLHCVWIPKKLAGYHVHHPV